MPSHVIWHITELSLWEAAQRKGAYTWATRGRTLAEEGFIHCSWPEQVTAVARRIYPDRPHDLVILEIDVQRVESAGVVVDLEPAVGDDAGEPPYPHVRGALPVEAVVRTRRTRWVGREFVVVA